MTRDAFIIFEEKTEILGPGKLDLYRSFCGSSVLKISKSWNHHYAFYYKEVVMTFSKILCFILSQIKAQRFMISMVDVELLRYMY